MATLGYAETDERNENRAATMEREADDCVIGDKKSKIGRFC